MSPFFSVEGQSRSSGVEGGLMVHGLRDDGVERADPEGGADFFFHPATSKKVKVFQIFHDPGSYTWLLLVVLLFLSCMWVGAQDCWCLPGKPVTEEPQVGSSFHPFLQSFNFPAVTEEVSELGGTNFFPHWNGT